MQKLRMKSGLVLAGSSADLARGDKAYLLIYLKTVGLGDCLAFILAQAQLTRQCLTRKEVARIRHPLVVLTEFR